MIGESEQEMKRRIEQAGYSNDRRVRTGDYYYYFFIICGHLLGEMERRRQATAQER